MEATIHLRGALVKAELAASLQEADQMIKEWRERAGQGEDPEEILAENGLEADYVMDLLFDLNL